MSIEIFLDTLFTLYKDKEEISIFLVKMEYDGKMTLGCGAVTQNP